MDEYRATVEARHSSNVTMCDLSVPIVRDGSIAPVHFPRSRLPLTVIAALPCEGYLLLGADSRVTVTGDVQVPLVQRKMDFRQDPPLAWGYSGTQDVGDEVSDWIRAHQFGADTTWEAFRVALVEVVARVNGKKRRLVRRSGLKPTTDHLANVIVAGYIAGEPCILDVDDQGAATFARTADLHAIGSGHAHARIADLTLRRALKTGYRPNPNTLGFVLEIAADLDAMTGKPIRILRIEPSGVTDLTTAPAG